jgi:predicted PurR-regulated permease PerM
MLGKIVELLSVNTRLQASAPYVLSLLSALVAIVLMGAFATLLTALVAGFGLWMLYSHMLAAGYPVAGALSAALGVLVIVLAAVIVFIQRLWSGVQQTVVHLVDTNTPPAAQAINGATSVASAFVSGLLGRRKSKAAKA